MIKKRGEFHSPRFFYHKVMTGFYVQPTLLKNKVALNIGTHKESLDRFGETRINEQRLETSVQLPLNQWVRLGTVLCHHEAQESGTYYQTDGVRETPVMTYIKVELIP